MKRKTINPFSLSFIDIMACGLGAVALMFVFIKESTFTPLGNDFTNEISETNRSINELNIKYHWKGKGTKSKCFDKNANCIIECDKEYFRPLEVDTLLGDSKKARKELKWKPKINVKTLVKEMVNSELTRLING